MPTLGHSLRFVGLTLRSRALALSFAGASALLGTQVPAHATLIGPTPYLSSADSPFWPFAGFSYFHLEDFEDGLLSTPGVSASGPSLCVANFDCFPGSPLIDSVDADNGLIDGYGGAPGHDLFALGDPGITVVFDALVLGVLPNSVGIVWTDGGSNGDGQVTFEAFDELGVSLGVLVGNHGDADNLGGTAEDRFYGATNVSGISKIVISHSTGGIEVDHLQYGGLSSLPEPGTIALVAIGLGTLAAHRRTSRCERRATGSTGGRSAGLGGARLAAGSVRSTSRAASSTGATAA